LLDGQSLTSQQRDALDAELQSLSQEDFAAVSDDLQTDHLLRAIHLADTEVTASSTERFVDQLKSEILSPTVPVAPPIETPPRIETENEVRLLAELKSDLLPKHPAARAPRRPAAVGGIVASAAAILLVLITAIAVRTGKNDSDEIAAQGSRDAQSTEHLASAAQEKPATGERTLVAPNEPAVPIDSVVVPSPVEVQGPEENVPAPESLATDHSGDSVHAADETPPQPPGEMAPLPKFVDPPVQPRSSQPDSQRIAVVTHDASAQWLDGREPGKDLVAGPLSLVSGTARLTLAKGAELTLEGPADLDLVDENRVALQTGRLEAFVPAGAVGFEVQTPGARVVDLGTRFRVHANPDEKLIRIDVVEGAVEAIQPVGRRGTRERKYQLTAGRTKWLPYDGLSAWDWQLVVQFGDTIAAPNQLTIDDQTFDLGRPGQAAIAMQHLGQRFIAANQQLSALPRGQRFAGRLVIDDKLNNLTSDRSLKIAQTELFQAIQKRWTNSIFDHVFPPGMKAEMEKLFQGSGISIPGVKP
jgi:ferric-dicitrate binding protein FerR (iron transport regulator)